MNDWSNSNKNSLNRKLLEKLISIFMPSLDKKFYEKYINYFLRILGTSSNLACFTNESTIVNLLENQVRNIYPSSVNYNKLEKFQNKLALLSTKKTFFSKRWAILYLLYKLSNNTNEYFVSDSVKNLQHLFSADEADKDIFSNINNKIYKNQNLDFEEKKFANHTNFKSTTLKNEDNPHFSLKKINANANFKSTKKNVIVIESSGNKKITEFDIINDLIFVFQGIDGHYINFNSLEDAFTLNSLISWKESIVDIVHYLCELGWLYKKVSNCSAHFRQTNTQSQFIQSFYNAVQTELNDYYK